MDLLESWNALQLLDAPLLWLALLVPLALWMRLRRRAPAVRFAPAALLEEAALVGEESRALPRSWRVRLSGLPLALQMLGLLLLASALARPAERAPLPIRHEGIDIILCLDLSSSMEANDLDPQRTRLEVVQEAAGRFIASRPNDRIGLIVFARYPDLRCPPTLDHDALQRLLGDLELVESDTMEDATGIGTAVARSAQVLGSSDAASRVVILLTDGEENVATADHPEEIAPVHAAQLCERLAVRVYTIAAGIGRQAPGGEWIPLDTSQVRTIAERTGGEYFEAREASAVTQVYETIDELETTGIEQPRFRFEDRFLPVLLGAIGVWLLGRTLRSVGLGALP